MQAAYPVSEKRIIFLRIGYIYIFIYAIMIIFNSLIPGRNPEDKKRPVEKELKWN